MDEVGVTVKSFFKYFLGVFLLLLIEFSVFFGYDMAACPSIEAIDIAIRALALMMLITLLAPGIGFSWLLFVFLIAGIYFTYAPAKRHAKDCLIAVVVAVAAGVISWVVSANAEHISCGWSLY